MDYAKDKEYKLYLLSCSYNIFRRQIIKILICNRSYFLSLYPFLSRNPTHGSSFNQILCFRNETRRNRHFIAKLFVFLLLHVGVSYKLIFNSMKNFG